MFLETVAHIPSWQTLSFLLLNPENEILREKKQEKKKISAPTPGFKILLPAKKQFRLMVIKKSVLHEDCTGLH